MIQILQERLQKTQTEGLYRTLKPQTGIDLTSNDYLGFAEENILHESFFKKLNNIPTGASGSRLLRGNLKLFEETETILARFVKRETAILFPSGYQANLALFSALLQPGDMVFSDRLNHASIIDGLQLSKATKIIYPHRDYLFLEEQLKTHHANKKLKLIVSESLFSMEGTLADVKQLANLASTYGALLIIDEAHSTGIWGPSLVATLGLTEQVFATIHTGGKALGTAGAWIAGNHLLKELMINFARPFIFSTAPAPLQACLLQTAIELYQNTGAARANAILERSKNFQNFLPSYSTTKESPIISLVLGENSLAEKISHQLQALGWDVRAIRPPTVPHGTARLRITVKWNNSDQQLKQFANDFKNVLQETLR